MKNIKRLVILLAVFILVSLSAGYLAGSFVYKDYRRRTAYLEKETKDKFGKLENSLKDLYVTIDNTVDKNAIERKELLSKIEIVKEEIRKWEAGYRKTLSELKAAIEEQGIEKLKRMVENLQEDMDRFEITAQDLDLKIDEVGRDKSVDLGKISVKQ
ncbi:MAG: hypothetical protein KJ902_03475 [Candidatus Omnitrophica bacterium]|nr:hypothetical protein [Candidatus Omnitrophota bacterium]MBU4343620.1 hypothetical protein [Candidatus Omnitrophota bacterium]MBU4457784.1 hypothetical protein [Candidatus Omnitrophota bacterium]